MAKKIKLIVDPLLGRPRLQDQGETIIEKHFRGGAASAAPDNDVETIVAGTAISVDSTDPKNPIVSSTFNSYTALANGSYLSKWRGNWSPFTQYYIGDITSHEEYLYVARANNIETLVDPTTSGMRIHLEADAIVGLNNGDPITTWEDSSPQGNDMSQATGAKQPTYYTNIQNSLPGVYFDGTDDFMSSLSNLGISGSTGTIYVVFKPDNGGDDQTIWATGVDTAEDALALTMGAPAGGGVSGLYSVEHGADQNYNSTATTSTAAQLVTVKKTAGSKASPANINTKTNVYKDTELATDNGSSSTNLGTCTNAPFRLGGYIGENSFFAGYVFEVIAYNTTHSDGTRAQIEAYLAVKWNTPNAAYATEPGVDEVNWTDAPSLMDTGTQITLFNSSRQFKVSNKTYVDLPVATIGDALTVTTHTDSSYNIRITNDDPLGASWANWISSGGYGAEDGAIIWDTASAAGYIQFAPGAGFAVNRGYATVPAGFALKNPDAAQDIVLLEANDGTDILTLSNAGALNLVGSLQVDSIVNDTGLAHGTYTPTLTNTTNLDASTARQCTYSRVGNTVTVAGQLDLDPTAAGAVLLGISLPVASNFSTAYQLGGTASAVAIAGQTAGIEADATNDRASLRFIAVDTTNQTMAFTFTYEVI